MTVRCLSFGSLPIYRSINAPVLTSVCTPSTPVASKSGCRYGAQHVHMHACINIYLRRQYHALTGLPFLPPKFSLGYHQVRVIPVP